MGDWRELSHANVLGEPQAGVGASSTHPPTRGSASAWGEPPGCCAEQAERAEVSVQVGGEAPPPALTRGQKASRRRKAPDRASADGPTGSDERRQRSLLPAR